MADSDAEPPKHPYKRFRSDYGEDIGDDHRSPQQQIYNLLESGAQHHLRFPENRADESYLVLEADATVKSKPCGATAIPHPSDTSGTETTVEDSSSDAGVAMGCQSKRRQQSPKKRSRTPDDDLGDDETGSERNEKVECREGELTSRAPYIT